MLRYLFVFMIFIHGLIHLMGFAKAFGYGNIDQISSGISHINGVFWLLAFLLFVLACILFLLKNDNWLWIAILGSIISQVLIFKLWNEAKFGTIANLLIVAVVIVVIAGKEMKFIFRD